MDYHVRTIPTEARSTLTYRHNTRVDSTVDNESVLVACGVVPISDDWNSLHLCTVSDTNERFDFRGLKYAFLIEKVTLGTRKPGELRCLGVGREVECKFIRRNRVDCKLRRRSRPRSKGYKAFAEDPV
jgi:hypothetical protein